MKILFVSDTYYPHLNGVYYFVCRLAPLLKEKGHEVAVIAPSETMFSTIKEIDSVDVFGIPSLPVLYYPKVRFPIPLFQKKKINKIIKDFKPDIVHIQDHFALAKIVIRICNDLNLPVIGTNHFMPENLTALIRSEKWKRKLSDWLWKGFSKVYNDVKIVTTPSETAAMLIRPKLNTRVISISSGIDLKIFNPGGSREWVRKKYNIPDKPVILFVGRLDPEKNIEETLVAVAQALQKIDFCFVIVGKGLKKMALERLATELQISDSVIFTGFVPDAELPFIYKLSNCFIISSIAELLSLGTLQGMAAGLPVIAVNAGALGELVHHGINGYLYEHGDIEAIAQSICSVLQKDTNVRMSYKSYEFVQKHDIQETLHSFVRVYEQFGLSSGKMMWREKSRSNFQTSL
jgi:1,2-diacylglycerol 3-alpha-glucosyltransferase